DPVRAVYRGETVCGSPACRRRAARAVPGINLRSINRAHMSAISDPETFGTSALELRRNLTGSTGGLNGERTPGPDGRVVPQRAVEHVLGGSGSILIRPASMLRRSVSVSRPTTRALGTRARVSSASTDLLRQIPCIQATSRGDRADRSRLFAELAARARRQSSCT